MDPKAFNLKKNYYIISTLNIILKLMGLFYKLFRIRFERGYKNNRIIMIGNTHIGDILMLTPALKFTKNNLPSSEIICIVSETSQAILTENHNVDKVGIINLPWLGETSDGLVHNIKSFIRYLKYLKKHEAETAINFNSTGYHIDHLAMWLAGIPNRIGFSHKGFNHLLTVEVPFVPNELIPLQKIRMVSYWLKKTYIPYSLKPDYFVSIKAIKRAENLLSSLTLDYNKLTIGINIGANHNFLWPDSYFIELCKLLNGRWPLNIVFIGTAKDMLTANKIMSQLSFKTFSLVGMTTLGDVAGIIKLLDMLITVDTGVRHLANAVGTFVIVLRNGANSIYEFGKYVNSEEIICNKVFCSPCGKTICPYGSLECMTGIRPETVVSLVGEKIEDILENKGLST